MKYLDCVNIKQGTKSEMRFSNGNTLPLTQLPFGMAHIAPQSKGGDAWWYNPEARYIEGFRVTHQPSPWLSDYGTFLIAPQSDVIFDEYGENWTGFDAAREKLCPHYAREYFIRQRCLMEATVSERCIKIRAELGDLPSRAISFFNLMGKAGFSLDAERGILRFSTDGVEDGIAKNFKMYCAVRIVRGEVDFEKTHSSENAFHLMLKGTAAELDAAISYISFEQAERNLREIAGKSFDEVTSAGAEKWEDYLSKIELDSETPKETLKTFYSCMYRTATFPNIAYELDESGVPMHYSPYSGRVEKGVRYVNNGFWDTSRTAFPLYSIIAPEIYRGMLKSALNDYDKCGYLPRWVTIAEAGCMPSTLIDGVAAQGIECGLVTGNMANRLLNAMLKHAETAANEERFGREGIAAYKKYGYVPSDMYKESVNLTLDFAYGDYCIAKVAQRLGKTDIAEKYRVRALNYRNIFDEKTGFMRPRKANGEFEEPFDPYEWGGAYTEASAWQTTFSVPHGLDGLAELMGGRDSLLERIDRIFEDKPRYRAGGYKKEIHEMTEMAAVDFGMCAISNQPSFSLPYIYAYFGETEKCEYWVKRICGELFTAKSDGFPGDEDNGSMAAWYILSMLGIYPICPADNRYIRIKPQVRARINTGKEELL